MNDDEPRVRIGLPVFNGENYLEEALVSILAQTYSDFELIISDDASTDRTQEICLDYAAKPQNKVSTIMAGEIRFSVAGCF